MCKRLKAIAIITILIISCTIHAQVGINTKDVRGVFHIDAGEDNSASGTITATQLANDVVVDVNGNMGVGTLVPTARLHLKSNTMYDAFRMNDGSEAKGRILQGDRLGNSFWATLKGAGGEKIVFYRTAVAYTNNVTTKIPLNKTDYELEVTADGSFSVILRWVPVLRTSVLGAKLVAIKYELKRRRIGVPTDVVCQTVNTQSYMSSNEFITQYTNLIAADVSKGDYLYIDVTFSGIAGDYLYIDRNWTGNIRSQQAFDSQAIIFYQL